MRFYKDGEQEEIYKIFNEGGILYFIERTDTNQFFYEPFRIMFSHESYIPDRDIGWDNVINCGTLSGSFLTKEEAEKYNNFTQLGCRYCGHGSKSISTKVTEHEFVPKKT